MARLPPIQDLGKEQEAARALPKEGQHLIIGGPGTGKSVLALFRARRHRDERDDYLFLVFNHLLDRASGQLFGDGLVSKTWIGWFLDTFEKIAGQSVPRMPRDDNAFPEIDWPRVVAGRENAAAAVPRDRRGPGHAPGVLRHPRRPRL